MIFIYFLLTLNSTYSFVSASSYDDSSIKQERWPNSSHSTEYVSFGDLPKTESLSEQILEKEDDVASIESEENAFQKNFEIGHPKNVTRPLHPDLQDRLSSVSLSSDQNSGDNIISPFSSSDKKSNQNNSYNCCELCIIS